MRNKAPTLLPILRSEGLARMLSYLLLRPGDARPESVSELARRLDLDFDAARRYVQQLEEAGVVRTWLAGRSKIAEADPDSPLQPELAALMLKAFGPVERLQQLLEPVDGIDEAHLYGSWAARYTGERGQPPQDIDLLVVGAPNVPALRRILAAAESPLGREINLTVLAPSEWHRPDTAFVHTVKAGPLVRVA